MDAGIQYLAAYKDDAGQWFDGAKTYVLVVPPDVPMLNFWSVVLYDNDTRAMIENPQGKTEVNSRQDLVAEADGSVRLVFAPGKPADVLEANWIQTNPEKGFFAYFRWYSPTQAFFDRSWKMGNIAEVRWPAERGRGPAKDTQSGTLRGRGIQARTCRFGPSQITARVTAIGREHRERSLSLLGG